MGLICMTLIPFPICRRIPNTRHVHIKPYGTAAPAQANTDISRISLRATLLGFSWTREVPLWFFRVFILLFLLLCQYVLVYGRRVVLLGSSVLTARARLVGSGSGACWERDDCVMVEASTSVKLKSGSRYVGLMCVVLFVRETCLDVWELAVVFACSRRAVSRWSLGQ